MFAEKEAKIKHEEAMLKANIISVGKDAVANAEYLGMKEGFALCNKLVLKAALVRLVSLDFYLFLTNGK